MQHTQTNRPFTVLFDAETLAQSNKSGVGYYTYQLVAALAKEYPDSLRLIGHYYSFLGRKKPDLPLGPNISYRVTHLVSGRVLSLLRRRFGITVPLELLMRRRGDVLLFPNFVLSPSLFNSPRIAVIHDLYFLEKPEHIQAKNLQFLRKYIPKTLHHANRILAVSNFTKELIRKTYNIPAENIIVTPVPPSPSDHLTAAQIQHARSELKLTKEFILFIGNLEPRKNLPNLIQAYGLLDKKLRDTYSLVLAGGKGWNDESLVAALSVGRQNGLDIITPGYITNEQRAVLYHVATLFAMPSLYEGFGMQLLESMQAATPVVASDIPVFHEVAGEACVYVNPLDPADIAAGLTRALQDSQLRKQLVAVGTARLAAFSWTAVAKDIYKAIEEIT